MCNRLREKLTTEPDPSLVKSVRDFLLISVEGELRYSGKQKRLSAYNTKHNGPQRINYTTKDRVSGDHT